MYKISDLGTMVGLSRTALLYYEKLKLIQGRRAANGYRIYDDSDVQRVRLIQKLQSGGLTLQECKACINSKLDITLLQQRIKTLDEEIVQKQQARALLAAMAGQGPLKAWHEELDRLAPDAHLAWLKTQGFNEKEALRLKWLSKDMNEHDEYMADFMKVFATLERWAPGSEEDTKAALDLVPVQPKSILEVGCGKGLATMVLAKETSAKITALDNEQTALERLSDRFTQHGIANRLQVVCENMSKLPFAPESFDLVWAEGSAYVIGVQAALIEWQMVIQKQGYLLLSDLVWYTDNPNERSVTFWQQEYPDMQSVETRIAQMEKAGYQVISHFPQSKRAWLNYYKPLEQRLVELKPDMEDSAAYQAILNEVRVCTEFADEFGYHMFLLQKNG
ncbi:MerR family transcriptional regulator [Thalassotalea mangrovi]|uniref:Methyltransferase domain-containing protein n=1 Tax=Thalassotalea mangrovi TaxID=2572245 RepID=A0A4V5NUE2_9GAMM|nr:MerR family transcriptional regulator [Thalassotalea mangrovi]TKB44820.1 methyltransferase domain-containing protein [Thalassotalea mangrovi]